MSTSNEIVTKAMRRLGLVAPGESPSAADQQAGVDALNSMIASWKTMGVVVDNDLPLGAEHDKAVIALLAVDIAADFGMAAPAKVEFDAAQGWTGICGAFMRVPNAQYDAALTVTPSYGYVEPLIGVVSAPESWKPNTTYAVGDTVIYRGIVYECTTAGVSDSTYGPTGAESSITDGAVVWQYKGTT